MPTRILRDGILHSHTVNRLSLGAELFYRRLMSVVDDYGRYHAQLPVLHAMVYTFRLQEVTQADVASHLKECVDLGLIQVYCDGEVLQLAKFGQRTRRKSKFPEPPRPQPVADRPPNGRQTAANFAPETEAEPESKTKTGTGGAPPAPPPGVGTHTHTPTWPDVLAYAQQIGCPEEPTHKFFDHFNGLKHGWENINWQNRLDAWWRQDQEKAAKQQAKPPHKVTADDFM